MKIEIRWSLDAVEEFEEVYDYWITNNNSQTYSKKLIGHLKRNIELISRNPNLGINTQINSVKMRLVEKNYYIIYKIESDHIQILKFWDTRQNPNKNKFLTGGNS